jgi:hypothetical protein
MDASSVEGIAAPSLSEPAADVSSEGGNVEEIHREHTKSIGGHISSSVFGFLRLFVALYLLLLVVGYPIFVSNQGEFDFSLLDGRKHELLFPFDLLHRHHQYLSELDFSYFKSLQQVLGLSNIAFYEYLARLLPNAPIGTAASEPLNMLVRQSFEVVAADSDFGISRP